uniref:Uncharacterized protein n=1 Tax=Anguilla anguilla TaxID=7936 RepID=A0A0E9SR81_ANGAN
MLLLFKSFQNYLLIIAHFYVKTIKYFIKKIT